MFGTIVFLLIVMVGEIESKEVKLNLVTPSDMDYPEYKNESISLFSIDSYKNIHISGYFANSYLNNKFEKWSFNMSLFPATSQIIFNQQIYKYEMAFYFSLFSLA